MDIIYSFIQVKAKVAAPYPIEIKILHMCLHGYKSHQVGCVSFFGDMNLCVPLHVVR